MLAIERCWTPLNIIEEVIYHSKPPDKEFVGLNAPNIVLLHCSRLMELQHFGRWFALAFQMRSQSAAFAFFGFTPQVNFTLTVYMQ